MCLEKLLATRILPGSAPVPLARYAILASWCCAYTKRQPYLRDFFLIKSDPVSRVKPTCKVGLLS